MLVSHVEVECCEDECFEEEVDPREVDEEGDVESDGAGVEGEDVGERHKWEG